MTKIDVDTELYNIRKKIKIILLKFKVNVMKHENIADGNEIKEGENYWTLTYKDKQFIDMGLLKSYFDVIQTQTLEECEPNEAFLNYSFDDFMEDLKEYSSIDEVVKILDVNDSYITIENPLNNGYKTIRNENNISQDTKDKINFFLNYSLNKGDNVFTLRDNDSYNFCVNDEGDVKLWSLTTLALIPKKCFDAQKDEQYIEFDVKSKPKSEDFL